MMLELKDLTFTAPESDGVPARTIIDHVSYTFETGRFYAVTGPNGSGKTTLAKLVMGILPAESGKIVLDGVDITEFSISERVMTEGDQAASSENRLFLEGDGSRANMVSRSVLKGTSRQDLKVNLVAKARCFGHIECDAILMDRAVSKTLPALEALHPDAELTHEASIGKIADDQLMKLMSLGLDYDDAVNRIIQAFLK